MDEDLERDFRIGELLGHGQFGAVYRCVSVSTGKAFAVKIMDKFSTFFNRHSVYSEIKLTLHAASGNTRCIQIHNVYEDLAAVYVILDLCPGSDLFYRIVRHGSFHESQAAALITELVQAIAECHRRGIVHRDIKPENILFDSNGCVILADFGCAALFKKGAEALKGRVGTPAYMAPEVIVGQEYDEKVDVWSAGVVLYVMLSQTLPFNGSFHESQAAALITELVQAIAECHRRGIVHRDIKPENILFDSNGCVILADFGCAALFKKGAEALKGRVGTPAYMAPEVIVGQEYDEKVDVWSAGVVLYVMLSQTLPFNGNSEEEIFSAVKKGDPLCFPKEFFHWSSPEGKDLVMKMLDRDPARRLSAEQVLRHPWIRKMTVPWRQQ